MLHLAREEDTWHEQAAERPQSTQGKQTASFFLSLPSLQLTLPKYTLPITWRYFN